MAWLKSEVEKVEKVATASKGTNLKNIDIIKRHEGLRLNAYMPTPNDKWTIGYGHTKTAKKGMTITEQEAERLLKGDLKWVEDVILKYAKVSLTQSQYDALASLIFNIGEGNFSKSTVLKRLNTKDYRGAADAFLMWNKQRNKKTGEMEVLNGLTKRRKEEREHFLDV